MKDSPIDVSDLALRSVQLNRQTIERLFAGKGIMGVDAGSDTIMLSLLDDDSIRFVQIGIDGDSITLRASEEIPLSESV